MQTRTACHCRSARLLVAVAVVACLARPVAAQQATPPVVSGNGHAHVIRVTEKAVHLEIIEKFARILELENKISRVDGFDESVVRVAALKPNQLHIQALAQGFTTIALTDERGDTYLVEVLVEGDVRYLQATINARFPNASVKAFKVRESVVLSGWVTQPEQITHIVETAEQLYPAVLNQMKVGGVQQVLLKVKVAEVQRSKIRQLGMNFLAMNRSSYFSSTPGEIVQLGEVALPFGGPPAVAFAEDTLSGATMTLGITRPSAIFNGFFEALKEEGLAKILAEPELVTTNGRPATLLSGGEFPILVPQSLGTVTIEWREFGVRLEAVPIILGQGRLRLELQPEVSERDFTNAVDIGGTTVPGLTTRRVNTQVEMKFGQTLMIGGLIATRRTAQTDKVPWLGELPVIGAAFRRVRYDDVETDLVVLVTPELVAPLEADQVIPGGPGMFTDIPTDRELFSGGLLEVPKYGDPCGANDGTCREIVFPAQVPGVLPDANPQADPQNMTPPAPAAQNTETFLPPTSEGPFEPSAARGRRNPSSPGRSLVNATAQGDRQSILRVAGERTQQTSVGNQTARSQGTTTVNVLGNHAWGTKPRPVLEERRPGARTSPAASQRQAPPGLIEP